jgi:anionic cell wall polymer biosynthesis LytR-Cps2A-Psr (LCP) family protein
VEYIQDLILDVNSNTAYTTIGAKQGDSEARKVRIYLTRGGDSYSLDTENAVAYFRFRKPDGKVIVNAAQIVSYDPAIIDI